MKRLVACVFLFLYAYNIAGYVVLFSLLQYRTRSEIKAMLKARVPEDQLTTFAFQTASFARNERSLQWVDDHEFRLEGKLYDVVRSFARGDTTYLVCINDVQEERLFEHLDSHVQREMGSSGQASKFDAFKDVFQDSLAKEIVRLEKLAVKGHLSLASFDNYSPFNPEVPSLPPRTTPA